MVTGVRPVVMRRIIYLRGHRVPQTEAWRLACPAPALMMHARLSTHRPDSLLWPSVDCIVKPECWDKAVSRTGNSSLRYGIPGKPRLTSA